LLPLLLNLLLAAFAVYPACAATAAKNEGFADYPSSLAAAFAASADSEVFVAFGASGADVCVCPFAAAADVAAPASLAGLHLQHLRVENTYEVHQVE